MTIHIFSFCLGTGAIAIVRAFFGAGTGRIWLDNVNCAGTEPRLANCPSSPLGMHNCAHSEDAGVRCRPMATPTPRESSLKYPSLSYGQMGPLVFVMMVLHRMYLPPFFLIYYIYLFPPTPQLVLTVTSGCKEEPIVSKVVWKSVTMQCGEQCVMICGALLMLTWCADNLDSGQLVLIKYTLVKMESHLILPFFILCSGATAISFAFFGRGTGPILLDNVACVGSERRLVDCPANPIGEHNCAHFEDAGVRCLDIAPTTPPCNT